MLPRSEVSTMCCAKRDITHSMILFVILSFCKHSGVGNICDICGIDNTRDNVKYIRTTCNIETDIWRERRKVSKRRYLNFAFDLHEPINDGSTQFWQTPTTGTLPPNSRLFPQRKEEWRKRTRVKRENNYFFAPMDSITQRQANHSETAQTLLCHARIFT